MMKKMMKKMVLVRHDITLGSIHRCYTTKIDKSIGILKKHMDEIYRQLSQYDSTPPMYEPPTPLEFHEMQPLVLVLYVAGAKSELCQSH